MKNAIEQMRLALENLEGNLWNVAGAMKESRRLERIRNIVCAQAGTMEDRYKYIEKLFSDWDHEDNKWYRDLVAEKSASEEQN